MSHEAPGVWAAGSALEEQGRDGSRRERAEEMRAGHG